MWPGQRSFILCDASCRNAAVNFSYEKEYAFYSWSLVPCKYKETATGLFLLLDMESRNGLNYRNTFLDHFVPLQQAIAHRILVEINRVMRGKWINSQTPLRMLQTVSFPLQWAIGLPGKYTPDTSLRVRKNVLVMMYDFRESTAQHEILYAAPNLKSPWSVRGHILFLTCRVANSDYVLGTGLRKDIGRINDLNQNRGRSQTHREVALCMGETTFFMKSEKK